MCCPCWVTYYCSYSFTARLVSWFFINGRQNSIDGVAFSCLVWCRQWKTRFPRWKKLRRFSVDAFLQLMDGKFSWWNLILFHVQFDSFVLKLWLYFHDSPLDALVCICSFLLCRVLSSSEGWRMVVFKRLLFLLLCLRTCILVSAIDCLCHFILVFIDCLCWNFENTNIA